MRLRGEHVAEGAVQEQPGAMSLAQGTGLSNQDPVARQWDLPAAQLEEAHAGPEARIERREKGVEIGAGLRADEVQRRQARGGDDGLVRRQKAAFVERLRPRPRDPLALPPVDLAFPVANAPAIEEHGSVGDTGVGPG